MVNYKIKFPINRKKNFRKNPIKKMTNKIMNKYQKMK